MANLGNFNPNAHEPSDPDRIGEVFSAGWYQMQIVESELKETKSGGHMIVLEFEMVEAVHPDLKGRKMWTNLNLWNPNQQAVEIAQRDLSAICKAMGHTEEVGETTVLHNRAIAVKARIKPAKGDFEARNEPTGYDSVVARFANGVPQQAATMTAPPQGGAAPVGSPAQSGPPPQGQPVQQAPPQGPPPQGQTPPWA